MGCTCESLGHVGSHWVKKVQPRWLQLFVGTGSCPCWQPDTHLLLQGRSRQEQLRVTNCQKKHDCYPTSGSLHLPPGQPDHEWCCAHCGADWQKQAGWKETPTARGTESKHTEALHPGYRKIKRDLCSEYTLLSQRKAISSWASAHCRGVGRETQAKICE